MEQSTSTYGLLSTVEQRHHKWLGCLSVRRKSVRSQSSSPDRRQSTDCLIDNQTRPAGPKIPKVFGVADDFPFFALTIKPRATLFLIYASDLERHIVLNSFVNGWGLESKKRRLQGYGDDGAFWIRLRNQPFLDGTGTANRAKITRTVCDCINRLRQVGWELAASIDLANQYPASTLLFEKRSILPRSVNFLQQPLPCLCISGSDTITLIDGSDRLIDLFKRTIAAAYEPGFAKRSPTKENANLKSGNSENSAGSSITLRLKGQPFFSHDRLECVRGRQLILDLVSEMDSFGYEPYGTLNLTASSDSLLFAPKKSEAKKRFMSISLILTNKIRLIDAPKDVVDKIRDLISTGLWPMGVEALTSEGQRVTKIKFRGHPWNPLAEECPLARKFLCGLFAAMAESSWRLASSYDLNRHTYNKSTFLFSREIDYSPKADFDSTAYSVFCLNLSSGSFCQLVEAPSIVRQRFGEVVRSAWPRPVTEEEARKDGVQDWTLHSSPFSWGKLYDAHARAVITLFVDECSKLGYRILTTANILTKYDMPNEPYPRDAHCIFFESTTTSKNEP